VHAALFIAIVWIVCRLATQLPAWVRSGLWWVACVEPLVRLAWTRPLELPFRHAPLLQSLPGASFVGVPTPTVATEAVLGGDGSAATVVPAVTMVALVWCGAVLFQAGWLLREWRRNRRVLQAATPVPDARIARRFATLRRELGVRAPVTLRMSTHVASAQVVGFLQPVVVLPAHDLDSLSAETLDLALAHELVHVRRGDLWLGWLPAVAHCLFSFHPLVRLAVREYALAREAACDAQVLDELDASPQAYGRLLIDLGIVRREVGAVAMAPSPKALARRLEMLVHTSESGPSRSRRWWLLIGAAVAATIPFEVVAVGPKKDARDESKQPMSSYWAWNDDGHRGFAFMTRTGSHMMRGTSDDAKLAKKLWAESESDLLFFRDATGTWVVRDAGLVQEAQRILAPQTELGNQQAELGERQAELGGRQAELGEQQAKLGTRQARLATEQARLAVRQMQAGADRAAQDDLRAQMHELSRRQAEVGQEQSELGQRQSVLGEQQSVLGERQSELGARQAELARQAEPKLWDLLQRARDAGVAEEIER
jgi:beta-lactamase regulating signal transducer with metallopeptidase domain